MDKKILVDLVKKEAEKLRKSITKKEASSLSFIQLYPANSTKCIYGQISGSCFSERANMLIEKCAERVYKDVRPDFSGRLNGKPKVTSGHRSYNYFSPIECFIGLDANRENDNNRILVDYLKGKTKKLAFKKF